MIDTVGYSLINPPFDGGFGIKIQARSESDCTDGNLIVDNPSATSASSAGST